MQHRTVTRSLALCALALIVIGCCENCPPIHNPGPGGIVISGGTVNYSPCSAGDCSSIAWDFCRHTGHPTGTCATSPDRCIVKCT